MVAQQLSREQLKEIVSGLPQEQQQEILSPERNWVVLNPETETERMENAEKRQLQKQLKVHHTVSGILIALSVALFMTSAFKMDKQDVMKEENTKVGYEKYTDIPSDREIVRGLFYGLAALMAGAVVNQKGREKEERFSKKRIRNALKEYGNIPPDVMKLIELSR